MTNTPKRIVMSSVILVLWLAEAWARCSDNPGAGAFIDAVRAQIEAQCPCALAASAIQYRVCAKSVLRAAVASHSLPRQCKGLVTKGIKRSTCGLTEATTCCR